MRVRTEDQTVSATTTRAAPTDLTTKTLNLHLPTEHWALLIREAERDDVSLATEVAAILEMFVWSLTK